MLQGQMIRVVRVQKLSDLFPVWRWLCAVLVRETPTTKTSDFGNESQALVEYEAWVSVSFPVTWNGDDFQPDPQVAEMVAATKAWLEGYGLETETAQGTSQFPLPSLKITVPSEENDENSCSNSNCSADEPRWAVKLLWARTDSLGPQDVASLAS